MSAARRRCAPHASASASTSLPAGNSRSLRSIPRLRSGNARACQRPLTGLRPTVAAPALHPSRSTFPRAALASRWSPRVRASDNSARPVPQSHKRQLQKPDSSRQPWKGERTTATARMRGAGATRATPSRPGPNPADRGRARTQTNRDRIRILFFRTGSRPGVPFACRKRWMLGSRPHRS